MTSMRKEWFDFVACTRKKMQRKTKEPVTHRTAMKAASLIWPTEKEKILKRRKREERKRLKLEAHCKKLNDAQKNTDGKKSVGKKA